ncbi:hypothetical protein [Undibacterium sp. TJN19]|uniref:hypothetical protein n=1 Tax=Undibacterium sp. TJN19 TaxID=3413055 RepID=UPI003BF1DA9E
MQFTHPSENFDFEIPDDWWIAGNALQFDLKSKSFFASSITEWPTKVVAISQVAAPRRDPGVEGLREKRTIAILQAITSGVALPALEVYFESNSNCMAVRDGFHRYYISIALGFSMVPVSVRPYYIF